MSISPSVSSQHPSLHWASHDLTSQHTLQHLTATSSCCSRGLDAKLLGKKKTCRWWQLRFFYSCQCFFYFYSARLWLACGFQVLKLFWQFFFFFFFKHRMSVIFLSPDHTVVAVNVCVRLGTAFTGISVQKKKKRKLFLLWETVVFPASVVDLKNHPSHRPEG